jgi:hypothetical protein
MKINPKIKAYAIIALIALLIPISINWFTFLAHFFSDGNDTPINPLEYKILTDSTAAVSNCLLLETDTISIPEKTHIKGNEYTVTKIEKKAFSYCRKLTNIIIPESVTEIEYSAFSDCSSLTHIKLTSNITCINEFTFNNCTNLKIIIIPSSVTSIGYKAFSGCNNLDVIINNSKDSVEIEMDAFKGCKSVRYTINP